jgi:hypothetical protein
VGKGKLYHDGKRNSLAGAGGRNSQTCKQETGKSHLLGFIPHPVLDPLSDSQSPLFISEE